MDGFDLDVVSQRIAELYLEMIFSHGFFHADPHPGNIFILSGERICLIDAGMSGSIDPKAVMRLALCVAVVATATALAAPAWARWDPQEPEYCCRKG